MIILINSLINAPPPQPRFYEKKLTKEIMPPKMAYGHQNFFYIPNFVSRTSFLRLEQPHDKTNKMTVRPVKTQISLCFRPVWSESSLCAQWVAKDPSFLHCDSKDSDQTAKTLIRLGTCHFVGFVMMWLTCELQGSWGIYDNKCGTLVTYTEILLHILAPVYW